MSSAIGAELTTERVCTPCNRRAGREVDQPWLNDPHVRDSRILYDVRDRRGKRPQPRAVKTELEDARAVLLRDRAGVAEVQPIPQTTIDESRGTVEIHGTSEDVAKAVKRFERDHPEVQWLPPAPGAGYRAASASHSRMTSRCGRGSPPR